jgi:PCFT/HCP family folate transporter-like MFS transporter 1/3
MVIMLKLPIWYLLVASAVDGLGGYYTTVLMGCFAYISDTTTNEQRRFRITVLEICVLMPGILGPLGAGKLLETIGFLYCFIITLIGQAINIIYTIFFVPETIQKDPSAKFFDLTRLRRISHVFCLKDGTNRNTKLMLLLAAFFISIIPTFDFSLDTLFIKNRPLCMSDAMVGYYSSTYLGVSSMCALVLAWLLKYCMSDQAIALVAGLASVFKNLYKAFVQNIIMMFMSKNYLFCLFYVLKAV